MTVAKRVVPKELLDSLLAEYRKPEDLIGENGLLKHLTKLLVERALEAEMADHLGHGKNKPVANPTGNTRNGTSTALLRTACRSRSVSPRRPFRHEARSPQVRTHSFTAQPPDLRHFALITRASRSNAHSPCSVAPSIRFLSIGSQFMLHASFPRSVALTQLRFTSFAVINLRRDLHPQECSHAGRT
jgi:hypothetical protein